MVQPGLEPETLELLAPRSNQLSYKTSHNHNSINLNNSYNEKYILSHNIHSINLTYK